jgi:cysteine desulfurase
LTPIYLDCNATTPLEDEVREVFLKYVSEEFGNEGSRTHEYGARAKQAVQTARDKVAAVVSCKRDEVIFTSGATESNNLAILGLREHGASTGRRHVLTSAIEHKAVLEPFDELERLGFEVTRLPVCAGGYVTADSVFGALRPDTLLVSVMQVNNETGIRQPLDAVCEALIGHPAFLHTDAAPGLWQGPPAAAKPSCGHGQHQWTQDLCAQRCRRPDHKAARI